MQSGLFSQRLRTGTVVALGIAAVGVVSWSRFDYVADDAFITLRYVRNLASGHGYVFNPGERVEGATNLLWALLLVPTSWLGLDLVSAARSLGVVFGGAAAGLVSAVLLARGLPRSIALTAIALVALQPDFGCWSGSGMETPLVAFLGMASVAAADSRWWGALGGLSFLTRPDGVLVATGHLLRRKRRGLNMLVLASFILAATVFRLAYFGALVPNTAVAKVGATSAQLLRGFEYVGSFVAHGGVGLLIVCALFGAWRDRSTPSTRIAVAWIGAQVAFTIGVGGDGLAMHRFFVPIVPPLVLLGMIGVAAMPTLLPRGRTLAVGLGTLAVAIVGFSETTAASDARNSPFVQRDMEVPRWSAVGRWFASHAPPDALVAAAPIGAFGYHAPQPVLDVLGLTDAHIARTPAALGEGRAGHERHDGAYVLDRKPAYLLLGNITVGLTGREPGATEWERDIDEDPRLRAEYVACVARIDDGMMLSFWYRGRSCVSPSWSVGQRPPPDVARQ